MAKDKLVITLELNGFRRFKESTFELSSPTVIIGPNGVGKTTILEALYYLSIGRSYRTSTDRDMIGWETDTARLAVQFSTGLRLERAVSTFGGGTAKQSSTNGVVTTPLKSLGQFHVVLFAPELIALVMGPPNGRRRYIDMLLAATDVRYAEALLRYQHALRQRNALLISPQPTSSSFDIWEQLLVDSGSLLIEKREALVTMLGAAVQPAFDVLEDKTRSRLIELSYQPTAEPDRYAVLLASSRERDRRGVGTSVGPHRDELRIMLGGKPMSFASRGEQRSLLIALKHAELELYKERELEVPPYLLLDDLFSELDQNRSSHLTSLLHAYPTIVTTTDATLLDDRLRDEATILDLTKLPIAVGA
jgi:DNA replication and repair protein RecF